LCKGKNFYWAEVVTKYNFPACRFLITANKYPHLAHLKPYDPTKRGGPWWYDEKTKTHYQNEKAACVEFMIDEDLYLDDSLKTEFVRHSDRYCCIERSYPQNCNEFGDLPENIGARLLGQILGSHLDPKRLSLTEKGDGEIVPSRSLIRAWRSICEDIWYAKVKYEGHIMAGDLSSPSIARAVLAAIGHKKPDEWRNLIRLFKSAKDAATACGNLLIVEFELTKELELPEYFDR
jgi:hypothetical protein